MDKPLDFRLFLLYFIFNGHTGSTIMQNGPATAKTVVGRGRLVIIYSRERDRHRDIINFWRVGSADRTLLGGKKKTKQKIIKYLSIWPLSSAISRVGHRRRTRS